MEWFRPAKLKKGGSMATVKMINEILREDRKRQKRMDIARAIMRVIGYTVFFGSLLAAMILIMSLPWG